MSEQKKLFDHLKEITEIQNPDYFDTLSESDLKTWSNFMIIRFLSMNRDWTELLGELQPAIQTLEPNLLYKVLITLIPKRRVYLKYVKGISDDTYPKWLVDLVCKEFYVSKLEASDYLDILFSTKEGKDTIKHLSEMYGTDPKEINKLFKK